MATTCGKRLGLSGCIGVFLLGLLLGAAGGSDAARASEWTDELAGRWQGRWTTESDGVRRPHQGTLRMNLRPLGDGSYQGTFVGRFAVVIPYAYRARVQRVGDTLISSKRLGPFGSYDMQLHPGPGGTLQGGWSAGSERGGIRLRR